MHGSPTPDDVAAFRGNSTPPTTPAVNWDRAEQAAPELVAKVRSYGSINAAARNAVEGAASLLPARRTVLTTVLTGHEKSPS